MTLVKWTPRMTGITPFGSRSLLSDFDRLFGSVFPLGFDGQSSYGANWLPAFDVMEKEKEYVVRVEAAGIEKGDFNVTVKDGVLTITGEKKGEEEKDGNDYSYRESRYGRFARSFRLPDEVNEKKVKANYKNGVLTISVPRSKPVEVKELEVEIN